MFLLRNVARGLRSLFRKEQANSELNEEMGAYLEMAAAEKMKDGLSHKEALRAVRLEQGTLEVTKEIVRSVSWESFLETCWRDVRFGVRTLLRSPAFTTLVVLTLALGIGANTALFTLIDAVMLKTLPVASPKQLYRLGDNNNCCVMIGTQNGGSFVLYSYPLYETLRDQTPEFSQLAAFQPWPSDLSVRGSGGPAATEPYKGEQVSGNYFTMLGIRPVAGRLLAPQDDSSGSPRVAVMSYHTWQQHFGLDPSVIGSTFNINAAPYTIAGVTPPGFYGDTLRSDPPDFWLPLAFEPNGRLDNARLEWLYLIGRAGYTCCPTRCRRAHQLGLGLAIGIPAALAGGHLLADQLYGVKSYDTTILSAAALVLAACAILAASIPARRATRIDPIVALRYE